MQTHWYNIIILPSFSKRSYLQELTIHVEPTVSSVQIILDCVFRGTTLHFKRVNCVQYPASIVQKGEQKDELLFIV